MQSHGKRDRKKTEEEESKISPPTTLSGGLNRRSEVFNFIPVLVVSWDETRQIRYD